MKKIFIKRFFTVVLCLLFTGLVSGELMAQETYQLTGKVTDDVGEALPGVAVLVEGTGTGTVTNINGVYTVNVRADQSLVFSFIGFRTVTVPVNGKSQLDVSMEVDVAELEEIVVIGYGTQKRSHLTGSVSKVTNEKLDQIPLARVDDALVGQVAGVNIQMTNPAAGEAPTIRVRGQGSISFNSNPLIVVDGIAVGTDADFLSSLDMNDVESMEVLKDAASSAIYGSRGANGIILITTKQGEEGPTQFSYNGYVGSKSVPGNDVLTSVNDWANTVRANNNGELTDRMRYIQQLGTNTDWEEVMMDGGMIQSHALSARGGTKNTKFRASLSYLDDEGVLLTDNFEKINFRLNLDTKVNDKIEFGVMLNPSHTEQRRFPIGVHDAIRQSPWLPLYIDENNIRFVNRFRENGRWADVQIGDYAMERMFDGFDLVNGVPNPNDEGVDISTTNNQSALAKVLERDRRRFQTKVFANTYVKLNIADGIFFKQTFGGDFRFTRNTDWTSTQATRKGASDSESRRTSGVEFHTVTESTLNFNRDLGAHSINAVAGFAYERWDFESTRLIASGFDFDNIETIPAANVVGGQSEEAEEILVSYLGRVNYAYKDKYLLSLSARTDGSSKFGPDEKFGFFPAASIGWNLTEEDFMPDSKVLSDLKLRVSYGVSGSNAGIGEYAHLGLVSPVGTVLDGGISTGYNLSNIANQELRWERLIEFNPGIDMSLLEGRISVSADYYKRVSEDLLLDLPIPSVTGFRTALVNRGEVENEGVELELSTQNYSTQDFSWSTSAIVTYNQNRLTDFAGANGTISVVDSKRPAEWIALEGEPISSFYGYVVEREIDPQFINDPFYPINGQSQDVYVKDLNGDGQIDGNDRTILGSPYPDVIWSVNNNFTYKGFDLTFMFQGSHGAEVRNIDSQYIQNEFRPEQDFNSNFPDADRVRQRIFTDEDIMDASYVALRNVNLGYRLPKDIVERAGFRSARVYVGAQNLLYIMSDDYEGYNPEGINQGQNNPLTFGYQRGAAPIFRTLSVGVNLEF